MNKLIFATLLIYSATAHGQTFAGLGIGVSSGAGFYAEHYFQPKWSLEANIGVPALGFGVNYVVLESRERFQNGRLYSAEELFPRGKKSKNTGRLTAGVTLTGAILPDVGLFQYRFWNLGLHKAIRKTDFGMELGLMRGAIVTGPSGSTYQIPNEKPERPPALASFWPPAIPSGHRCGSKFRMKNPSALRRSLLFGLPRFPPGIAVAPNSE